jgi:hypothetical protein
MESKLAPTGVTLVEPDTSCCQASTSAPTDEILDVCTTGRELAAMVGLPTCCDRDRMDNVWVEGDHPETGVVCMLDNLTIESITEILSRDHRARADLTRVTSVPYLRDLAQQVPMLSGKEDGDKLQQQTNQTKGAGPFYALFRGVLPQQ